MANFKEHVAEPTSRPRGNGREVRVPGYQPLIVERDRRDTTWLYMGTNFVAFTAGQWPQFAAMVADVDCSSFVRTDGTDQLAAAAVADADLRDVAAALWQETHKHPAGASCECPALAVIGRLLTLGYRIGRPGERLVQHREDSAEHYHPCRYGDKCRAADKLFIGARTFYWRRGAAPDTGPDRQGGRLQRRAVGSADQDVAQCIGCGCTEDSPCPDGCYWVPRPFGMADICSTCAAVIDGLDEPQRAALCTLAEHVAVVGADAAGQFTDAEQIAAGMISRAWPTGADGARMWADQLAGLGLAERRRRSGRPDWWRITDYGRAAVDSMGWPVEGGQP